MHCIHPELKLMIAFFDREREQSRFRGSSEGTPGGQYVGMGQRKGAAGGSLIHTLSPPRGLPYTHEPALRYHAYFNS